MTGRGWKEDKSPQQESEEVEVRSVLFVPFTPGGTLAKQLREVITRLRGLIGGGIKVVERTGTPLARHFALTRLWDGLPCPRSDCITCTQGGEGNIYPCTRRNLVYENICLLCHPNAGGKQCKLDEGVVEQSVYVGESSRSMYERSKEHWNGYKATVF